MSKIDYNHYHEVRFLPQEANIYFCPKCNNTLEDKAYKLLGDELNYLESINYNDYSNDAILKLEIQCCSTNYSTYFHKYKKESASKFFLIDIVSSHLQVNGIYTREECQIIFEKLTRRWSVLYDYTVLATPFVGYEQLKDNQILDLGNWMLECINPNKTILITRTKTLTRFDKAFEESEEIKLLKEQNRFTSLFEDAKKYKKSDFHAKVYMGFSSVTKTVEVLEGSWNIGPASDNFENLSFRKISIDEYSKNYCLKLGFFVLPFKIKNQKCLLIEDKKLETIDYNDEIVNVINNITNYKKVL